MKKILITGGAGYIGSHCAISLLENGFIPRYISANCNDKASIYIFSIGFKDKKWENKIPEKFVDRIDNKLGLSAKNYSNALGAKVI